MRFLNEPELICLHTVKWLHLFLFKMNNSIYKWVECLPMIREIWVQSLIPPCSILTNIRYLSRIKWSNPGKGVVPSPTPWCSSYWKGSLLVAFDYGCWLYFYYLLLIICLHTVKWFQVLLCITNNLIKHLSFVCTQLND